METLILIQNQKNLGQNQIKVTQNQKVVIKVILKVVQNQKVQKVKMKKIQNHIQIIIQIEMIKV